jgi:uncharacterized delta-60 repeat protein
LQIGYSDKKIRLFIPAGDAVMNLRPARRFFLSALLVLSSSAHALAAAPGLDPNFGKNGRTAVEIGAYGSRANAVAVQPDGKIVVGGSSAGAAGKDFMLFRLLPDGTLDPEFGQNGTVSTALSAADDEVLSLSLQEDGKIIAAGYSSGDEKNRDFALARFNSDGTLDKDFGAGGVAVTAVGGSHDEITDVTVQEDGRIVITGAALDSSGHSVVVLGRYSVNGAPDQTFAEDGFALSIVGFDAQAESVAVAENGRILVSGSYSDSRRTGLMLLGFTADGQLDSSFGEKGIAVPADSGTFSEGYGMFFAEDGTILVAGSTGREGERDAALFRFNADGGPDSAFGGSGVIVTKASGKDDVLYDAVISGGTLAAAGFKTIEDSREFLLITYAASQDDPATLNAVIADSGRSGGQEASTALAAAEGSVVAAGESVADSGSSAEVSKYALTAEDSSTVSSVGDTEAGNQYILTGEPYEVTRTTAVVPGEILDGFGGSVTERGIVFSTMINPVLKDDDHSGGEDGAPVISDLAATVSGTSATLSLTTDVEATCKYDAEADTEYDQMERTFTSTGATSHSTSIDGLVAGEHTYYVRCKNTSTSKANTEDAAVSFEVGGSGGEDGPDRSSLSPEGPISATSATLSLTTDVDAICKYDLAAGTDYDQMANTFSSENEGTRHSAEVTNLKVEDGQTYTYYVRCKDTSTGEKNTTDAVISFAMQANTTDDVPPEIENTTEEQVNSSSSVTLSVSTTDESATCRYHKDEDASYDSMKAFQTTGGTAHSAPLGVLSASVIPYVYYVRCEDSYDNQNTSGEKISFIATPVVITDSSFDSGEEKLSLTTDVKAKCKYNKGIDAYYEDMSNSFTVTANTDGKEHEAVLSSLESGSYVYYARCKDESGNESTKATEIVVTVTASSQVRKHSQLIALSQQIVQKGVQTAGSLFVGTAIAADDDTSDDDSASSSTTASSSSSSGEEEDEEFLEEGSTSEGTGTGAFSSRLENLKPGTFFYARAYAVKNGSVYYGNQVGFKTADSCFIATAAFGSIFHPSVQVLRDFRDRFLTDNPVGRSLVGLYYRHSPPLADVISQNSRLRFAVRILLLPAVGLAWLMMQFGVLLLLPPVALAICWHSLRLLRMARKVRCTA